jgi:adhesin transport system membrane fusion protein
MMAWFGEKAFKRTGKLVDKTTATGNATFGPLVKRLTPAEEDTYSDWEGEADWARLQQEPMRARAHAPGGFGAGGAGGVGRVCRGR